PCSLAPLPPRPSLPRLLCRTEPAPRDIHTLSLHDALPISLRPVARSRRQPAADGPGLPLQRQLRAALRRHPAAHSGAARAPLPRSEEHTSELQSRENLVCRLLLEKKHRKPRTHIPPRRAIF